MAFLNWNVAARPAQEQYGNYENYMTSVNTAGAQQANGLSDDEQAELSSGLNGNTAVAGDSFVKTTGNTQEAASSEAVGSTKASSDSDSIHEQALRAQADTYDPEDEAGSTSQAYTGTNLAKEEYENAQKEVESARAAKRDADAAVTSAQAGAENSQDALPIKAPDDTLVPNLTAKQNAKSGLATAKAQQEVANGKLEEAEKKLAEAEKKYVYAKQNQDKVFNSDYSSNPFAKDVA